jgi:hypothetical protein
MDQRLELDQATYEQRMYWDEFVQLKADACYIREYRNALNGWVTSTATIRAVASSGGIAAWVIWQRYAFLWASIIALSQLADALKDVFPFQKRRTALSRWVRQLDRMFVVAQRDWDAIAHGRCRDEQISKLLHQLRSREQRLQAKYVPDGLARNDSAFQRAEAEAVRYFALRYGSIEE